MRKSFWVLGTLLTVACATVKLASPAQTDADRAAQKFPGTTLAMLNEGKMHYENNCGKCHKLPNPKSESEAEWRKIVPDMAHKAKVDSKTEDLILRYVVTMGPGATGN